MRNVFVDWLLQCHDFQECYAKKHFWTKKYPRQDLPAVFSWDDLNHCLNTNRITNDRLRLSTAQGYEHFNRRVFRATKDSFGRPTDHLLIHELQAVMRGGVSAVLEAVNELTTPTSELTQCLTCELGVRSAANAYMSFGATSGFGVHNDDHDVIVIQIDGRKRWQFFSSPPEDKKATVDDLDAPSESDSGDMAIVEPGDVMYIPKGTWHDVTAMNEKSLHLTISLVNPTLLDFVQWVLKKKNHLFSRHDIRCGASPDEHLAALSRDTLESLFNGRNLNAFLDSYHASHAVSPIKATFPTLHAADGDDTFRRIFAEIVVVEEVSNEEHVAIFALGRIHHLTRAEYTLILALPYGAEKPGSALQGDGRHWDDIAAALTSLMDRGLVGKTPKNSQPQPSCAAEHPVTI
jgi:hypothetical protein